MITSPALPPVGPLKSHAEPVPHPGGSRNRHDYSRLDRQGPAGARLIPLHSRSDDHSEPAMHTTTNTHGQQATGIRRTRKGLTAAERAFHAWYYTEGLLGMQRAREATPGSDAWAYEQYTAFNREWTATAWAQHPDSQWAGPAYTA